MPPCRVEQLIESVACAATAGPRRRAARVVRAAILLGRRAAERGRFAPLPALLDAIVAGGPGPDRANWRGPVGGDLAGDYDRWLEAYRKSLARHRPARGPGRKASGRVPDDPLGPFLAAWPAEGVCSPAEGGRAYAQLLDDEKRIERVVGKWQGPRNGRRDVWARWCPAGLPTGAIPARAVLRARLGVGSGVGDESAEAFDHAAGRLYLDSEDIALLPGQADRLRRLRWVVRSGRFIPQVDAIDEQHPTFGVVPVREYLPEDPDAIAHRITNHECMLLTSPPPQSPARWITVHLAWRLGARGGAASMLRAATALVLDDLRSFLRPLGVRFELHPPGSEAPAWAGGPGLRFKGSASRPGRLPPAEIVRSLLRRPSRLEPLVQDWPVVDAVIGRHWAGLVTLQQDLEAMEWVERPSGATGADMPGRPRYVGPAGVLPETFDHVIALDPVAKRGEVFAARRVGGTCQLLTMTQRADDPQPDRVLSGVRHTAVDAVLAKISR